ncbi:condensation domain-containing protein, partial [Motilimonas sp. E26]|uniref:condensation domain-containing protein n=1 Tax=Motilimonas sp. E26 TaxID=2865674 RepID=UPI001E34476F
MSVEVLNDVAKAGVKLYLDQGKLAFKAAKGALTDTLKQSIINNKEGIISALLKQSIPVIESRPSDIAYCPLSFSQQGLWLLDSMSQGSAHYNIMRSISFNGKFDLKALNESFKTILRRHESLRATYHLAESVPYQIVQDCLDFNIDVQDFTGFDKHEREQRLQALTQEIASSNFDLEVAPMIRVTLVKVSETYWQLLLCVHHIASDGWSVGILIKEFMALYSAYSQGKTP